MLLETLIPRPCVIGRWLLAVVGGSVVGSYRPLCISPSDDCDTFWNIDQGCPDNNGRVQLIIVYCDFYRASIALHCNSAQSKNEVCGAITAAITNRVVKRKKEILPA